MKLATLLAATFLAVTASSTLGAAVTFTGASGLHNAEAKFEVVGSQLVITLTNSSLNDCLVPIDALGAVLFDSSTPLSLTTLSAKIASGSAAVYGVADASGDVGGEFVYSSNVNNAVSGAPGSQKYGISAVGFSGMFGAGDPTFSSQLLNPTGGTAPDGPTGGILSAGDNTATGNGGLTSTTKIKDSVVFTFSGAPANFDPYASIKNVAFLYGTAPGEAPISTSTSIPNVDVSPVPLPPAVWSGLSLLGVLGGIHFAKRKATL